VHTCHQQEGKRASDFWLRLKKEASRGGANIYNQAVLEDLWHCGLCEQLCTYINLFPTTSFEVLQAQVDQYEAISSHQVKPKVAAVMTMPLIQEQLTTLTVAVTVVAATNMPLASPE
jgi:hypothetical protein